MEFVELLPIKAEAGSAHCQQIIGSEPRGHHHHTRVVYVGLSNFIRGFFLPSRARVTYRDPFETLKTAPSLCHCSTSRSSIQTRLHIVFQIDETLR